MTFNQLINYIKYMPDAQIHSRKIHRRGQFTVFAVLCMISGFLMTLDNIGVISGVWKLWPIFPFTLGLGGIWFFLRDRSDAKPLGIGLFLIQISIFFFILNFTGWAKMTELWPTFIAIFGTTLVIASFTCTYKRWILFSGLFFIFLAAVFFVVFTVDTSLWPISLMLFGFWILMVPRKVDS